MSVLGQKITFLLNKNFFNKKVFYTKLLKKQSLYTLVIIKMSDLYLGVKNVKKTNI